MVDEPIGEQKKVVDLIQQQSEEIGKVLKPRRLPQHLTNQDVGLFALRILYLNFGLEGLITFAQNATHPVSGLGAQNPDITSLPEPMKHKFISISQDINRIIELGSPLDEKKRRPEQPLEGGVDTGTLSRRQFMASVVTGAILGGMAGSEILQHIERKPSIPDKVVGGMTGTLIGAKVAGQIIKESTTSERLSPKISLRAHPTVIMPTNKEWELEDIAQAALNTLINILAHKVEPPSRNR